MKSRHSTRFRSLSAVPRSRCSAWGDAKTPAEANAFGNLDVATEPRASSSAAAKARARATRDSTVNCPASGARSTTPLLMTPPSPASSPPDAADLARNLDAISATSSNVS
eukprot:scaffold12897_cov29-Tisochrysis_lutea.AAC.5